MLITVILILCTVFCDRILLLHERKPYFIIDCNINSFINTHIVYFYNTIKLALFKILNWNKHLHNKLVVKMKKVIYYYVRFTFLYKLRYENKWHKSDIIGMVNRSSISNKPRRWKWLAIKSGDIACPHRDVDFRIQNLIFSPH